MYSWYLFRVQRLLLEETEVLQTREVTKHLPTAQQTLTVSQTLSFPPPEDVLIEQTEG